ncbi:MAG: LptF/LptG family permease [Desulfobacteraceae bacterium]|nr:LptF/LptG family permease [Desulfobacteraceae bacterium]
MPLLLYIYLATEILAPFLAALVILNAILFLGKLVPLLQGIFSFGIGAADFVRLWAYMSPGLLVFSIPMASMMGVIVSFTRLSSDNELIALKASGISLYRMLPPVIAVALVTASLTGLASVRFIPQGSVAMKQLLFQIAKEKIDRGMRERQFSESLADVVLYADRVDPKTGDWKGVYISDLRDKKTPLTVVAHKGRLQAHIDRMQIVLELTDGTMHRAIDDLTQTLHFDHYELNVPVQVPQEILGESTNGGLDKSSLTLSGLLANARRLAAQNPETAASLMVELHERLVLPVGCFLLTILGLPLALASRQGRRPLGLPLGLGLFILYYVLITGAKGVSENGILPIGPTMWLPNLLALGLMLYLVRSAARERQGRFVEYVIDRGRHLAARLPFAGKSR